MTIEQNLQAFVDYCRQHVRGDEKGEAQVFLDRLFVAFGYPDGIKGAGGTAEQRIKSTLEEKAGTHFADLVIPGRVLMEMKKRGSDLQRAQLQALDYWKYLTPHPRYVVTCNFDEFWVYDMERQVDTPIGKLTLPMLAEPFGWRPLAFLLPEPETPAFKKEYDLVTITEEAARSLSNVFNSLLQPHAERLVSREEAQRFILQLLVALFSEDIGLLPSGLIEGILDDCQRDPGASYELFTLLFTLMNSDVRRHFRRWIGVPYFNGGIFSKIAPVLLASNEVRDLQTAARHNWAKIRPSIFGTIFERSVDDSARHKGGIHYTSEGDIRRIVDPVIGRPWSQKVQAANGPEALRYLHAQLCAYTVLDPACGSGNFLYMAYRELKRVEALLLERLRAFEPDFVPERLVSVRQFYGFDTNAFAVELAKVTLMIAKKLAVDETHSSEPALPLDNLDANIRCEDALFADWGDFDACIGNPPYLGAKRLKVERGVEYVNRVRDAFPDVPGDADYCVYWFRKAHDLMKPGARAGLVGTNTIRQNYSRIGGLDYVVANGGTIYEAVSSQPWTGDAKVHVSIVCWSKGEPPYTPIRLWLETRPGVKDAPLKSYEVSVISSSLSIKTNLSGAKQLDCNIEPKHVFQGIIPGHEAFVIEPDDAKKIIKKDSACKLVILPYMVGRDLLTESQGKPSRYVIDFNEYDVIEAERFREPFQRIRGLVLPVREGKAKTESELNRRVLSANPESAVNISHQQILTEWWKHTAKRLEMTTELRKLKRYVVCSRVTKRPVFEFLASSIRPSDMVQVFAFDDDYTFGILQSNAHWQWFTEKASTLKSDYRYTPHSVFDTFPFPQQPTPARVKAVADAGRALHEWRRARMVADKTLTLRDLYRSLEQPGRNPLKDLHAALDAAVLAAYGFAPDGDVLAQLLALNLDVAANIERGESVTAPGVPADYPAPAELVSAGCITPPDLL